MDLNGILMILMICKMILMDLNGIETVWRYIGIEPSTIGISYAVVAKNMGLNCQMFGDKTDT